MRIPKKYGEYRRDACPFCGGQATRKNSQGVPVCHRHISQEMPNLKCICGDWVDIKEGKYGVYCQCLNCGNVNFNKVLELNQPLIQERDEKVNKSLGIKENNSKKEVSNNEISYEKPIVFEKKKKPNEITITSDELDFI